jgi:hypothetical protein
MHGWDNSLRPRFKKTESGKSHRILYARRSPLLTEKNIQKAESF